MSTEPTKPGQAQRERFVEHSTPEGITFIHSPRDTCKVCRPAPVQPTEINDKKGWDYDPQATLDAIRDEAAPVEQPAAQEFLARDGGTDADRGSGRASSVISPSVAISEHRAETSAEPAGANRFDAHRWLNENAKKSGWKVGRFIQLTEEKYLIDDLAETLTAYAAHVKADAASKLAAAKDYTEMRHYARKLEAELDAYRVVIAKYPAAAREVAALLRQSGEGK